MSPRTKEQFAQMRQSQKDKILKTALHLFASKGYHATAISEIAMEAGISKGLLYNYFTSKEDLLKALLVDFYDQSTAFISLPKNKVDKKILSHYIDNTFTAIDQNRSLWKLYFSLMMQPVITDLAIDELTPKLSSFQKAIHDFFIKKYPKESIVMLRYFHSVMDGAKIQYLYDPDNYPIEAIKEQIKKQFL